MVSKKGRPRTETVAVMLRIPPEIATAIDDLRQAEVDLPSRPEMIRRMLRKLLEAKKSE